ncbi:UdgX family uracil-DNA binding protein [Pseudomonas matsuisoli]|uniref:Type-4 uracil-DNA glycosylase n=1 Tax=Pseudomonas matsuisoli TaxID=1515666 RepID=A0A917Q024_9PSED|nr:UdgX family uracil-DNA binding protein [Pseudomonas matsuisoli]GGK03008.1 uracil-DNA glycosylase [Pseudomonas matsuisoli]
MRTIHFAGSFEAWRPIARKLLLDQTAPDQITWQAGNDPAADLFASPDVLDEPTQPSVALAIPRKLPELLKYAACYRAPDRWALLYRVLWRVTRGDRSAMLAGDIDGAQLHGRVKSVRREAHHMHAFLRFAERAEDATPRFVAWHEPAHDVLELASGHFHHRMGSVSWLIATPEGAAVCDGTSLSFLSPCPDDLRQLAQGTRDDGEALWRAYYSSTFNPARVNEKVMRGHMPARFWKHLPEGDLIPQLATQARAGQQKLAQTESVGKQAGRQVLIARERAQPVRPLPTSLDECRQCDIWQNATCAVPGAGSSHAQIMLIGEQPGDHEDLAGRPFVGPAGQILDQALASAGLDRAAIFVTNAVKHFKWEPRGGIHGKAATRKHATPKPAEIRACRDWLTKELADIKPLVLVALGRTALASILEVHDPQRIRLADYSGRAFKHDGRWVLTAPHPAAILRNRDEQQRRYFEELCHALTKAAELISTLH